MSDNPMSQTDRRVAVFAVPEDPSDLADVLTDVLGLHPTDAMIQVHSLPGVLPQPLSLEQAERLAAAILETGVRAEIVGVEDCVDFHHGEAVHHCKCTADGLEIIETHGSIAACVPWSEIDLICVGVVPQETGHHFPLEDMPFLSAARRSPHAPLETPATAGPELWLVSRNPFHAYRIDHRRMNYEYVGDRKTDSATVNIQAFLHDLLQFAPHAYVTPSTRAILGHGVERQFRFESADHLRRYAQFQLLIHRHSVKSPEPE